MIVSDSLSIVITRADGSTKRWGPDELNAIDIPSGLTFSTSQPGGFKDLTCQLLRDLRYDQPDQALFDTITVYGPGQEVVWEGRMQQFPANHGDTYGITPGAVGWAAHLKDDTTFKETYVDRDLSGWGEPSYTRQAALLSAGYTINASAQVVSDNSGDPALLLELTRVDVNGTTKFAVAESLYRSTVPIGNVYYDQTQYDKGSGGSQLAGASWAVRLGSAGTDTLSGRSLTSDLAGTASAGYYTPASADHDHAYVNMYTEPGSGTVNIDGIWRVYWRKLAVYGTHGLTRRGADPGGLYASDVVADIVSRAAPLLTYTTGADGSIQPTTFEVPHLVFRAPTTAEAAISTVNAYHGYEWGCWEDKRFYFRQPSASTIWQARLADGAQASFEGDDASGTYNGVIVSFTDPWGVARTAGPVGSGCDYEDDLLKDSTETNPVNAHGIPRKYLPVSLSSVTTSTGAIQIGTIALGETLLPARRGSITVQGTCEHPTMGKRPVWAIRAGDYITLADRPNDPARRIISTSYSHDSRSNSLSLEQTSYKLDAILERIGVSTIGTV